MTDGDRDDAMNAATPAPVELETGASPEASIIWLHGLGADGHDFEAVVPELELPAAPALRFVFPHAPLRPVTINAGFVMRAWYDITPQPDGFRENPEHVREAAQIVEALIGREQERGMAPARIVLAGFSQGGAIALHTALRYRQRLAGVLVLSSYLLLAQTLAAEREAANADVPIFMAHGEYDPLIPIPRARASLAALERLGYSVEWHSYPIVHSVSLPELTDVGRWLAGVTRAAIGRRT